MHFVQNFRRNDRREARLMPPNRHKWQAENSAETAECSELLPYVRRVQIVTAVAADVREGIAENAKENITQSRKEAKKYRG